MRFWYLALFTVGLFLIGMQFQAPCFLEAAYVAAYSMVYAVAIMIDYLYRERKK